MRSVGDDMYLNEPTQRGTDVKESRAGDIKTIILTASARLGRIRGIAVIIIKVVTSQIVS